MTATRRLAAILAADVAGYSRLIGADEGGTLRAPKAIRVELIDPQSPRTVAYSSRQRVTGCSVAWSMCLSPGRRPALAASRRRIDGRGSGCNNRRARACRRGRPPRPAPGRESCRKTARGLGRGKPASIGSTHWLRDRVRVAEGQPGVNRGDSGLAAASSRDHFRAANEETRS